MQEFDLVIRGGEIHDGLGSPGRRADIGILDGRIHTIGGIAPDAGREIDAGGCIVTPGFVDIHTHYDGQATWEDRLWPSSFHGVTTVVMGNCGVGFAPVRPADQARLIEVMEGIEDIPGSALHEGLSWNWESFPDYLDALEAKAFDADVAAQVPHAALRLYVMGERGARLEPATKDDIEEMRRIVTEAIRAGALGFTTSRTRNHRTAAGDPTPSLRAEESELTGIAHALADAGSGVMQFISDFASRQGDEFGMLSRVVKASGRPASISLAQAHARPDGWKALLERIEASKADGLDMRAQVAPRPIGVMLGLQTTYGPFQNCPSFKEIADRPLPGIVAIMKDKAFRHRLLEEERAWPGFGLGATAVPIDYRGVFPLGKPPDYEPAPEKSIAAIARRLGITEAEAAYDLLLEDDGKALLLMPFANFAQGTLEPVRQMLSHERSILGLGDGGAHVGIISDASFPTYLLSHWGRDRAEGRFDLPFLIRKMTSMTAAAVGLHDRGTLEPGMKADINVIDLDALGLGVPEIVRDLPAGGKRLVQRSTGYRASIVSGVPTYLEGEATGALPGRLVRGEQRDPRHRRH
ncbi:MAG: amidohydrolase family protein [Burkholderiaceae bacterium]|jgi:N-acyl-D-aspartate/D-glutamate deacylase|nr:amidohydrolase family protein [Burkholderiaceae bacterium]